MSFTKAEKSKAWLKMSIEGVAGSGKTKTALKLATLMSKTGIALIDSEHGSSKLFADEFDFYVMDLEENFSLENYQKAIKEAASIGCDVLIVDSLSHAWMGSGGALEEINDIADKSTSKNKFIGWNTVTPKINELINTILGLKMHVIVTFRSKTEYQVQLNEKGKMTPVRLGMKPIFRDEVDFEFYVCATMDSENVLSIYKTKCSKLDNYMRKKPDCIELAGILEHWLCTGKELVENNPDDRILNEQWKRALLAEINGMRSEMAQETISWETLENYVGEYDIELRTQPATVGKAKQIKEHFTNLLQTYQAEKGVNV